MAKLTIVNGDGNPKSVELPDGSPIRECCGDSGLPFGCEEGICGTCIIDVCTGVDNLSEPTQEEADFLGDVEDERLACQCAIKRGSVTVKI